MLLIIGAREGQLGQPLDLAHSNRTPTESERKGASSSMVSKQNMEKCRVSSTANRTVFVGVCVCGNFEVSREMETSSKTTQLAVA